jgi:hypothetical protein
MFPKDVHGFGCADLSKARDLSWFPRFESQLVPVPLYQFELFLESAEMRQTSPLEQVAWARVTVPNPDSKAGSNPESSSDSDASSHGDGGQLVGVATGDFDADALKFTLTSLKIPVLQMGNDTLYDAGTGSGGADIFFTVVDWRTIVFGSLAQLKRILRIRQGDEDNLLENQPMMTMIDQANGEGIFWGVLDSSRVSSVVTQLVPEAANFPQAHDMSQKMKQLLITVKAPSDIEVNLQVATASPEDALLFSQLLQAGILMRQYQAGTTNNPELVKLLGSINISASGDLLKVSAVLTDDQLISLIEHDTFATE